MIFDMCCRCDDIQFLSNISDFKLKIQIPKIKIIFSNIIKKKKY